jgi:hypothetical protein
MPTVRFIPDMVCLLLRGRIRVYPPLLNFSPADEDLLRPVAGAAPAVGLGGIHPTVRTPVDGHRGVVVVIRQVGKEVCQGGLGGDHHGVTWGRRKGSGHVYRITHLTPLLIRK